VIAHQSSCRIGINSVNDACPWVARRPAMIHIIPALIHSVGAGREFSRMVHVGVCGEAHTREDGPWHQIQIFHHRLGSPVIDYHPEPRPSPGMPRSPECGPSAAGISTGTNRATETSSTEGLCAFPDAVKGKRCWGGPGKVGGCKHLYPVPCRTPEDLGPPHSLQLFALFH
jgi:hypothetical protein